jgi:hypothetical protein
VRNEIDQHQIAIQKRLDAADKELIKSLLEDANRKPAQIVATPTLGQLTEAQIITEKNTAAAMKQAEALPDGTTAASNLSKASTEMERAIALASVQRSGVTL